MEHPEAPESNEVWRFLRQIGVACVYRVAEDGRKELDDSARRRHLADRHHEVFMPAIQPDRVAIVFQRVAAVWNRGPSFPTMLMWKLTPCKDPPHVQLRKIVLPPEVEREIHRTGPCLAARIAPVRNARGAPPAGL